MDFNLIIILIMEFLGGLNLHLSSVAMGMPLTAPQLDRIIEMLP
jgi:hypothetical protein